MCEQVFGHLYLFDYWGWLIIGSLKNNLVFSNFKEKQSLIYNKSGDIVCPLLWFKMNALKENCSMFQPKP